MTLVGYHGLYSLFSEHVSSCSLKLLERLTKEPKGLFIVTAAVSEPAAHSVVVFTQFPHTKLSKLQTTQARHVLCAAGIGTAGVTTNSPL